MPLPRHALHSSGPRLVKVRTPKLIERRTLDLTRASPGRWAELFQSADVVSEGQTRSESGGFVYYGSTSVLLLTRSTDTSIGGDQGARLVFIASRDPHVRLRALRVARREASARAGGDLGTTRAEIDVAVGVRGLHVLVEVVARLAHLRDATLASMGEP